MRRNAAFPWVLAAGVVLTAAVALTACGSHSADSAAPAGARTVARKPVNPLDQLSRNMVSAVAATKPSTVPVQVKFELLSRPDLGQPVEVDLAIVPMSGSVDRVAGKVEGEDGLELLEGAEIAATDRPAEGVPIRHSVKVVPRREGILTVRAAVTVDAAGVSTTESYSIPLVASAAEAPGTPPTPAPAAPAPARVSQAPAAAPATAATQ